MTTHGQKCRSAKKINCPDTSFVPKLIYISSYLLAIDAERPLAAHGYTMFVSSDRRYIAWPGSPVLVVRNQDSEFDTNAKTYRGTC